MRKPLQTRLVWLALCMPLVLPASAQDPNPFLAHITPMAEAEDIESGAFAQYFERVGRWDFAPDVMIADWNGVRFGPDGRFVGLDLGAGVAQYFAPDGRLLKTLDLTECEPGFAGQLTKAAVFDDGSFLIMPSGGVPGFWFDTSGTCTGRFDYGRFFPLYAIASLGHRLITVRRVPPVLEIEERADGDVLKRTITSIDRHPNLNGIIPGGGLHRTSEGRLYVGMTTGLDYAVFDSTGRSLGAIGETPAFFRGVTQDAESHATAFGEYMSRVSKLNSIRVRSFLVGDALVSLAQNGYEPETSPRRHALHAIRITGELITSEDVYLPRSVVFVGAFDDLLFRLMVPDDGEPFFAVYRIRG
ncbi:MAG: hypothetical protein JJ896_05325 [Rhodothermales bacterium]|nr:hypothetical protein [Rhodothermales bacterium]MBO6779055.1 hypothetical protein [Rhodothermales bacterium]